jgi:hypothetical protein
VLSEQKTGGELNLVKPQMSERISKTIPDLASNMQKIDDGHSAHVLGELPHRFVHGGAVYRYGLGMNEEGQLGVFLEVEE